MGKFRGVESVVVSGQVSLSTESSLVNKFRDLVIAGHSGQVL